MFDNVSVEFVAPERGRPFNRHWKVCGPTPLMETLNTADALAGRVRFAG
jgi:hypothetical protein